MTPHMLFPDPHPAQLLARQPVCALAIDAEEDFDWQRPLPGIAHDTACMRHLGDLQSITAAYGARPTYLLTYPVLQDAEAVRGLRRHLERGECALGLQLHTWVTPPIEGAADIAASFSGNIPPALEEQKLRTLIAAFEDRFGLPPLVYRAGRYGVGRATALLLERHGFEVDVSLAPRTGATDEGGPDFSAYDCAPFWFGERRRLLEVPLCRSLVGWGGGLGHRLYQRMIAPPATGRPPTWRRQVCRPMTSMLTRLRAAERITLSPEGNDPAAIRRLVRSLLARGQRVLTLSFHSSSLRVGRSPYVRTRAELHGFYDRLSAALHFLAGDVGCRFADLPSLPALMAPPLAAGPFLSEAPPLSTELAA